MVLYDDSVFIFTYNAKYYLKQAQNNSKSDSYVKGAAVKNTMIANGSIIEGEVENSVVSRSVKIGKGSIVRNSIIMQKSQIGDNCIIDGVIIDKDVKIGDGVVLKGTADEPYVVEKGSVQNSTINSYS
ncbi:fucose pyrophosphorylase domain-containing protein [Bacillus paranthracis]